MNEKNRRKLLRWAGEHPIYSALAFILLYTVYDKIVYLSFHPGEWWSNLTFYTIALVILPLTAILLFRDRESVVFYSAAMLWYLFGLEDILFSVLFGEALLPHMDWLDKHFFIGGVAQALGSDWVTPTTILASVTFATAGIYVINKLLKEEKKR